MSDYFEMKEALDKAIANGEKFFEETFKWLDTLQSDRVVSQIRLGNFKVTLSKKQ